MRRMNGRFGGCVNARRRARSTDVCRCDVTPIFDAYVREHRTLDFAPISALADSRLDSHTRHSRGATAWPTSATGDDFGTAGRDVETAPDQTSWMAGR